MHEHAHELPHELRLRIKEVVKPGETVLWAGQPDWRAAWGHMLAIFLLGLFVSAISFPLGAIAFGGATGLWPVKFNGSDIWPVWARLVLPLIALPFVTLSCVLLFSPIAGIRCSTRTVHIVTGSRFIDAMPHKVDSRDLSSISSLKLKARKGGTGTITIGLGWEKDSDGDLVEKETVWVGVPEAEHAIAAIRRHRPGLA